jgi:Bleomycin resistance protein-like N-terminal
MAHAVTHFEVSGKDLDKLQSFYSELFGWKVQRAPGEMPYAMVEKEGDGIGGGIGEAPDGNGTSPSMSAPTIRRPLSTRPSSSGDARFCRYPSCRWSRSRSSPTPKGT